MCQREGVDVGGVCCKNFRRNTMDVPPHFPDAMINTEKFFITILLLPQLSCSAGSYQ
jgi:hypothetical protein